jgi:carotenoid cleavage dioxygenase-like enzyme
MEAPLAHYTLFDKNRKMINRMDIKLRSVRMIHDFPITNNFIIIPDMPLEFKPDRAIQEGGSVFKYDLK